MNRFAFEKTRKSVNSGLTVLDARSRDPHFAPKQHELDFLLLPAPMWTMNKLYRRAMWVKQGWIAIVFKGARQMRSS